MNSFRILPTLVAGAFLSGAVALAQDAYQPLPSASNPYQAHGGANYGRARSLNDMELTAITRVTEGLELQALAVDQAREAMLAASFASPANPADVAAKARALADAENRLAIARADAFARLKGEMRFADAERIVGLANMLNTPGGRPGGGGGGGGNQGPTPLTAADIMGR